MQSRSREKCCASAADAGASAALRNEPMEPSRAIDNSRGVLRFLQRILRDRNRYGAIAFAETAESLRLNLAALQVGDRDRVAGITASGDCLLALLATGPEAVMGFDANDTQTLIAQLKAAAICSLSVDDYRGFMGIDAMSPDLRLDILNRISRSMPSGLRRKALGLSDKIQAGILNDGMSYLIVRLLCSVADFVLSKDTASLLFAQHGTKDERRQKIGEIRRAPPMRLFLQPALRLLAPRLKWHLFPPRFCQVSKRPEEIIVSFLDVFEDLFAAGIASNPVLCRAAVGRVHPEWNAHLYNQTAFTAISENLSRLTVKTTDFTSGLKDLPDGWATRLYLSNMPDYLTDQGLFDLVDQIRRVSAPDARIVYYSLYDQDLLGGLGRPLPSSELKALRASDDVFIYPVIMVRTMER